MSNIESEAFQSCDSAAVINEALAAIDGALNGVRGRELVSSNEVADTLLDLRTLLTASSSVEVVPVTA